MRIYIHIENRLFLHKYSVVIVFNLLLRAVQRDNNQGLGTTSNTTPEAGDNEYDAYRKRMMLAYRFRPNPLVILQIAVLFVISHIWILK